MATARLLNHVTDRGAFCWYELKTGAKNRGPYRVKKLTIYWQNELDQGNPLKLVNLNGAFDGRNDSLTLPGLTHRPRPWYDGKPFYNLFTDNMPPYNTKKAHVFISADFLDLEEDVWREPRGYITRLIPKYDSRKYPGLIFFDRAATTEEINEDRQAEAARLWSELLALYEQTRTTYYALKEISPDNTIIDGHLRALIELGSDKEAWHINRYLDALKHAFVP